MNLNKHLSFFNPFELRKKEIHIIGCGAIGSNVAVQLAKLGIEQLYIWDFDTVNEHNITNQVYTTYDVGMPKTAALERHLKSQNPEINVIKRTKYTNQNLKGIVFLCVDSIETRNKIAKINEFNISIDLIIDGRIGLETGQVFTINWKIYDNVANYINLTDFKDNEVDVPVSPCGTTLSVSPSVLMVVATMISNVINFSKNEKYDTMVNIHAFNHKMIATN